MQRIAVVFVLLHNSNKQFLNFIYFGHSPTGKPFEMFKDLIWFLFRMKQAWLEDKKGRISEKNLHYYMHHNVNIQTNFSQLSNRSSWN